MAYSPSLSSLDKAFDDFLYTCVGNDLKGLPISVLTILARQDIDPWLEATKLDRLQLEPAVSRLLALMSTLPAGTNLLLPPQATAERLIKLLPHRHYPRAAIAVPEQGSSPIPGFLALAYLIMMILLFYWNHGS